jgi:hypothetical protein
LDIKKQPTIETSVFGAEFVAMKHGIEKLRGLRYKIRMMGFPRLDPHTFMATTSLPCLALPCLALPSAITNSLRLVGGLLYEIFEDQPTAALLLLDRSSLDFPLLVDKTSRLLHTCEHLLALA